MKQNNPVLIILQMIFALSYSYHFLQYYIMHTLTVMTASRWKERPLHEGQQLNGKEPLQILRMKPTG